MPILHTQFLGQGQTSDGQIVQIPPPVALQQRGPCLQASVSVADSIAKQLLQQGRAIPSPISGAALIDTGASVTCIDDQVAQQLKLPVVDVVTIGSASHAAHQAHVYPISIDIAGLPIAIDAPRAVGAALAAQGLVLLIGRDVLQFCTLFYNGTTGEITLSM